MSLLTKSLPALLLSLSVGACGVDTEGDPSAPSDPAGSETETPAEPTPAMSVDGTYRISSHFDLSAANIEVVEQIAAFAEDPVGNIADQLAQQLNIGFASGLIENALQNIITADMEDQVAEFMSKVQAIGLQFDVASELSVSGATATHRTVAMETMIDGTAYSWSFNDSEMSSVTVASQTGSLQLDEHSLAIPYGDMIVTAIDEVLVPQVVAGGQDIGDALAALIDCGNVGQKLADNYGSMLSGFGVNVSAATLEGLCETGVDQAADKVYDLITGANGLNFNVALYGTAAATDMNGDGAADTMSGEWQGRFTVAGASYENPSAFTGERM